MTEALVITPSVLTFPATLDNRTITSVIRIENVSEDRISFKIKTTSPKRYCVTPNIGIIAPNHSTEIKVFLNIARDPPAQDAKVRDRFQVLSMSITENITDSAQSLKELWQQVKSESVNKQRLKVVFLSPKPLSRSNDSVQTPIIDDDNHEVSNTVNPASTTTDLLDTEPTPTSRRDSLIIEPEPTNQPIVNESDQSVSSVSSISRSLTPSSPAPATPTVHPHTINIARSYSLNNKTQLPSELQSQIEELRRQLQEAVAERDHARSSVASYKQTIDAIASASMSNQVKQREQEFQTSQAKAAVEMAAKESERLRLRQAETLKTNLLFGLVIAIVCFILGYITGS